MLAAARRWRGIESLLHMVLGFCGICRSGRNRSLFCVVSLREALQQINGKWKWKWRRVREGAISQGSQSTIRAAEHLVSLLGLGLASSLLLLAKFLYLELDWTLMKGGYQNDFIWQYVCAFASLSSRECGKIIFLYGTIIDGLCKKGKTRMAARWLCKKGTISVNVLADALTKEGNAKEVKEVIELLKEMEVGPLSPPDSNN
ncbi:hypothetical protein RHMOL_Rhmol02G0070600 [Rhododendron molle]|uniref:Uncharacterized protein n=1 Tax=Rhododendron molle TaxID=49168 RepID=A0ACC0PP44_RHOML|nr:hypothetical protein RHMOL_Rhmol02G0070600 [Rhododendron molle]